MKGFLVTAMYKVEMIICFFSIVFFVLFIYKRKKLKILKIKSRYSENRNRRMLKEGSRIPVNMGEKVSAMADEAWSNGKMCEGPLTMSRFPVARKLSKTVLV